MSKKLIPVLCAISLSCVSASALAADLGSCGIGKMASARPGDICHTSTATWRVENYTHGGQPVYFDLTSKIAVATPITAGPDFDSAAAYCKGGFGLPTAYLPEMRKEYSNPPVDSDFTILKRDRINDVIYGTDFQWFWSKTADHYQQDAAWAFHGTLGDAETPPGFIEQVYKSQNDAVNSGWEAVLCIKKE